MLLGVSMIYLVMFLTPLKRRMFLQNMPPLMKKLAIKLGRTK